jgi:hypothetical protein
VSQPNWVCFILLFLFNIYFYTLPWTYLFFKFFIYFLICFFLVSTESDSVGHVTWISNEFAWFYHFYCAIKNSLEHFFSAFGNKELLLSTTFKLPRSIPANIYYWAILKILQAIYLLLFNHHHLNRKYIFKKANKTNIANHILLVFIQFIYGKVFLYWML